MKKMLFVMNPYAGIRRAARYLTEILSVFNRAGYEVIIHMTAATGDAFETVRTRAAGNDIVVCCGGDGTLNETVSGLLEAGLDIPIGYIPSGSTNDFAASLKLSTNTVQAAKDIVEGEPMPYDVGRFGDRYFAYVASFGAFTKSSYATPQYVKNALGHTAYLLESITELSQIRKFHIRMEIGDEVVEDDFLFGAISNSTSVGGVLTLDPNQVDMGDGLFESLLLRAPRNLLEITECITAVQAGRYNDCKMITFCSADKVKVFSDPDMPWTLDGEKFDGAPEIPVENVHHAIRLIRKVETA
jgi:YegS/Rv2252/BmrU family lipid kinase